MLDTNLRNSGLHKLFKLENVSGFAQIFEGKVSLKEAVHNVGPNLDVITVGKTNLNPVILFDSVKVKEFPADMGKTI